MRLKVTWWGHGRAGACSRALHQHTHLERARSWPETSPSSSHMDLAGSRPSASAAGYFLWHLWRSGVRVFIRALVCSVLLPAVGFGVIRPSIPGLTLYSKIFADLTAFVKISRRGSFIFWAPSFFLSRETILAPAYLPSEAGNYQDPERALGCSLSG